MITIYTISSQYNIMITLHLEFKKGKYLADITIPQFYAIVEADTFTVPSQQKWTKKIVLTKQPFKLQLNGILYPLDGEMEMLPHSTFSFARDDVSKSFEADVVFEIQPYF